MMSLQSIRSTNRESAEVAAEKDLRPYVVEREDLEDQAFPPFPFPSLGDHRPEGWELIESHFVDSSGFGRPGESALTVEAFVKKLKPGMGYAIIEEGQFQLHVGEFKRSV